MAGEVIDEAEKRGVLVLITERMSESFAVLVSSFILSTLTTAGGTHSVPGPPRIFYSTALHRCTRGRDCLHNIRNSRPIHQSFTASAETNWVLAGISPGSPSAVSTSQGMLA